MDGCTANAPGAADAPGCKKTLQMPQDAPGDTAKRCGAGVALIWLGRDLGGIETERGLQRVGFGASAQAQCISLSTDTRGR